MSGSGPQVSQVSSVTAAADTAEHVLAAVTGSWNNPGGNYLSVSAAFTGAAAGTVTLRVRQGSLTGTQVGPNMPFVASSGSANLPGLEILDTSSFATTLQANQSYVLTYQQSAVSLGTFTNAALGLETASPVQ